MSWFATRTLAWSLETHPLLSRFWRSESWVLWVKASLSASVKRNLESHEPMCTSLYVERNLLLHIAGLGVLVRGHGLARTEHDLLCDVEVLAIPVETRQNVRDISDRDVCKMSR